MSWTCMQSFSFIPLTASKEKIFEYFFENLPFFVAMATNQIQWFRQISYESQRTTQETFLLENQNICSETAKIANFHFSYYKSMATIRCHSNQRSDQIEKKKKKKKKNNTHTQKKKKHTHTIICSPSL